MDLTFGNLLSLYLSRRVGKLPNYQYEIRRALGSDTLLVAMISNSEINHFMDRGNDFIDGTTYFYSVVVRDIGGKPQPIPPVFIKGFSNP